MRKWGRGKGEGCGQKKSQGQKNLEADSTYVEIL